MATASAVAQLCRAYRDALESIDRDHDAIEREIGRAALRLEVTQAYARLASDGRDYGNEALRPFGEFVAGLSRAGTLAEWTVAALDASARRGARSAMYALAQSLLHKSLLPGTVFVIGVASGAWLSAQQLGAALLPIVLAAGIVPVALWAAKGLHRGLGTGWVHTLAWATALGRRSDKALAVARSLEPDVVGSTNPAAFRAPFTTRARRIAIVVVGLGWVAVLLGIAAVLSGFVIALEGTDACVDPDTLKLCDDGAQ